MKSQIDSNDLFYVVWDLINDDIDRLLFNSSNDSIFPKTDVALLIKKWDISKSNILVEKINYNKSILLHCFEPISGQKYLSLLVLVTDTDDLALIDRYSSLLIMEGTLIKNLSINNRREQISEFAQLLINPKSTKIVFIGFPNSGKTSVKLFYFEKVKDTKIINQTITPTQGVETTLYDFMSLNTAVFDTSGQELDRWFEEPDIFLSETDIIIFFTSIHDWQSQPQVVITYLDKLQNTVKNSGKRVKIKIFCHKIDLINSEQLIFKENVRNYVKPFGFNVAFTSIKNGGNFELMNSFYYLFEDYSQSLIIFKNILIPIKNQFHLKPITLFDSDLRIITQFDDTEQYLDEVYNLRTNFSNLSDFSRDTYHSKPLMINFIVNNSKEISILLYISKIFPNASYLYLKSDSFDKLNKIYDYFNN